MKYAFYVFEDSKTKFIFDFSIVCLFLNDAKSTYFSERKAFRIYNLRLGALFVYRNNVTPGNKTLGSHLKLSLGHSIMFSGVQYYNTICLKNDKIHSIGVRAGRGGHELHSIKVEDFRK